MKIVIIGGGFAGIAAAKKLYNKLPFDRSAEIILIDKSEHSVMLPSLPDLAGGRVKTKYLLGDIRKQLPGGITFLQKEVTKVNLIEKKVYFEDSKIKYDYLIISSGSKTNFYDKDEEFQKNYKLESLEDALKIQKDFKKFVNENEDVNVVVSGAGFTGLELASSLFHSAKVEGKKVKVSLIERSNRVLPMLSEERSSYVMKHMRDMGIDFITEDEVLDYKEKKVSLKSGLMIENAFFCWSSGVRMGLPVIGDYTAERDGRIIVDENLRMPEHPEVFVAGDAAAFKCSSGYIRRAVNFSYMAGQTAGYNIAATILKAPLKAFKVVDLGWVIPLYVTSIGEAFGVPTKGRLGIMLHYVMCGLKNYSLKNFIRYCFFALQFVFTKAK